MPSKSLGKEGLLEELRMKFVMSQKQFFQNILYVSDNFVPKGSQTEGGPPWE